jgi:hypothetical protein
MDESDLPVVSGELIVAEYKYFKHSILHSGTRMQKEADRTFVTSGFICFEGDTPQGHVREKIRGGKVGWLADTALHPITTFDDDPETMDRISVERTMESPEAGRRHSGIVYREFSDGDVVIVDKTESYTVTSADVELYGQIYTRVNALSGEVLEYRRMRPPPLPEP